MIRIVISRFQKINFIIEINTIMRPASILHDDIIKWNHFPCYWLFVSEIHQSLGYISKCIFLNENVWISIKILVKFVPEGRIQIMTWRRPGDMPLFEPMTAWLLTYICVTRPQLIKNMPPYHDKNFHHNAR